MREEINEYFTYLLNFNVVKKPSMPKFNVSAYTENEYVSAVNELMLDFNKIDDYETTLKYLKGDWCK